MNLIMLPDFLQILNIKRKNLTKNEYFPKHNLFSTLYLYPKQRLNHNNYSEQKINLSNFIQPTEHDAHMHTKIQDVIIYRFLYINTSSLYFLEFYTR
jgi:hypothetical protein